MPGVRAQPLEIDAQTELQRARVRGACNLAEVGIAQSRPHSLPREVVRSIVEFGAELRAQALAEAESLLQRGIPVVSPGSDHDVAAEIPKQAVGRQCKSCRVEPL